MGMITSSGLENYAGQTIYILVNEGEILEASFIASDLEEKADSMIDDNREWAARECGYDPEELDEDDLAEMNFMGGFYGGSPYVYGVYIPDEEENLDYNPDTEEDFYKVTINDSFITNKNDQFTYQDVIDML
jgi:hypothetical protein